MICHFKQKRLESNKTCMEQEHSRASSIDSSPLTKFSGSTLLKQYAVVSLVPASALAVHAPAVWIQFFAGVQDSA